MKNTMKLTMSDQFELSVTLWSPPTTIRGMIYIVHGMVEHIQRYDSFATFLNNQGFLVFGDDHRGHGETWLHEKNVYFAHKNGAKRVLLDTKEVLMHFKSKYNVPTFILGHSMGSYITRAFLLENSSLVDGAIISGTGNPKPSVVLFGLLLSSIRHFFSQNKTPDALLDSIAFSTYNKRIMNPRTTFDWLSRDIDTVQKYINDPKCGQIATAGFWKDFFKIIEIAISKDSFSLSHPIPIFVLGGAEDPVGEYGKATPKVAANYKTHGLVDVTMKLYEEGRHEMLNETNRDEVFHDILHFIEMHNF